jgi:uncharacterized protein (DUF1499 family)
VTPERPSVVAALAAFVGGAGGGIALLAPLLAHFHLVEPFVGFRAFLLGGLLSIVGLVLGIFGLRATRGGRPGRDRAWFAVGVGGAVLLAVLFAASPGRGLPRINDITTSPEDPPVFETAAREEANAGRDMGYPSGNAEQQRAAYPDRAPSALDVPPSEAFERARRAAEALGWEIVRADPSRGALEAREASGLFRFVDDVVVRVRARDGGAVVDVRSKSRDGQGDLGANATRIRAFAAELSQRS